MNFGVPPLNSPLEVQGPIAKWSQPWANWMTLAWGFVFDVQNSGITAQRPTTNLYPGKFFFDTSLGAEGQPIWLGKDNATWVLADGTPA